MDGQAKIGHLGSVSWSGGWSFNIVGWYNSLYIIFKVVSRSRGTFSRSGFVHSRPQFCSLNSAEITEGCFQRDKGTSALLHEKKVKKGPQPKQRQDFVQYLMMGVVVLLFEVGFINRPEPGGLVPEPDTPRDDVGG